VLISNAFAQARRRGRHGLFGLLPLILMFVLLYFLLIRPQAKRAKEHRSMLAGCRRGTKWSPLAAPRKNYQGGR